MFITATKVAIVEALRSVWFQDQDANDYRDDLKEFDKPYPRRISIEYSEEAEDWPFVLVQVRPNLIQWTGITPDEIVNAGTEDSPTWKRIRQGKFEASCMLQIMALTSAERDRIWDNLILLIMMGRTRSLTRSFHSTLETNDLVGITINEASVRPIGDTISVGTPWDPEMLSYEATIEFDMTGVFYADEFNEDLLPISEARVYDYLPIEPVPGEGDDEGSWKLI